MSAATVGETRTAARFSSNRDVAMVQADYLALANDLEQAQALSSELESQLSGKTNELAQFKLIFERTQNDLVKFAQDLDTMRKERHALANEVQCAYATEHKFEKLKVAHETLQTAHEALILKAERLDSDLIRERAAHVQSRTELDELCVKLQNRPAGPGLARDPELRRSMEVLREQLQRVLGPPLSMTAPPAPTFLKPDIDHIEIEFSA